MSFACCRTEALKIAAGNGGAVYRVRAQDLSISEVIVSTRTSHNYHRLGTVSSQSNWVHQLGSQGGQVLHMWVCLLKVHWLSRNLK